MADKDAEFDAAVASNESTRKRLSKGWRHGPYNHLLDPLPYDVVLPTGDPRRVAAPAPAPESADGAPPSMLRRSWARTRAGVARALDDDGEADVVRIKAPLVREDELVALPFKPPTVWHYIREIVGGTWELVLYVVVMLLAIMLETNVRYFRSGSDYDRWWVYLYKVVVVCYPAGLMVVQFVLLCEYVVRRYMAFRLLSLGIMVQPERRRVWQSWYFVFFVGIWVILNVWAWWGLIQWWGRNGKSGPEYLSFAVLGVVNVVSFHLLMYYSRLTEQQKRLLKPLQAYLLPETVVVSELAIKHEMWRALRSALFGYCWPGPTRFDVEWVRQQGVRIPRSYGGQAEAAEAVVTAHGEKALDEEDNAQSAVLSGLDGDSSSSNDAAAAAATAPPVPEEGMDRLSKADPRVVAAASDELAPPPAAVVAGVAAGATLAAPAGAVALAALSKADETEGTAAAAAADEAPPAEAVGAAATSAAAATAEGDFAAGAALESTVIPAATGAAAAENDAAVGTGAAAAAVATAVTAADAPAVAATAGSPEPAAALEVVPAAAAPGLVVPSPGPVAESAEDAVSGVAAVSEETEVDAAVEPTAEAAGKPGITGKAVVAAGAAVGKATLGACRRCCVCCFRCSCCLCCCIGRLFDPRNYTSGLYALPTAVLASVSCSKVWPFRRDLPFLRAITLTIALCSFVIGGGLAFGAWLAARNAPICQWGLDSCLDCLIYQEEYVAYDKVCGNGGYNITKDWPDPDYYDPNCPSGRSWFTNGVWSNNETTVLAQHGDYQNITGQALVNGYLANIMSYYAYSTSFEGLQKGFEGQYIKRFKELFTRYGFTEYEFIFQDDTAIDDTQFIIAGTGKDVYMIFRGTDGLVDTVVTDLSSRCIENTDYGKETCVHKGFLSAYRQVQSKVYSGLVSVIGSLKVFQKKLTGRWTPVDGQPFSLWLTGHSLGGALATLCAMDLRNKGLKISGIYTYGSPRVGDPRFKELYASYGLGDVTWRYVHRSDMIPQVPPKMFGFEHVTAPYVVQDEHCTIWPNEDECPHGESLGICAVSASDHMLPGYLSNIRSCIVYSDQLPDCTEAMLPLWAQMEGIP